MDLNSKIDPLAVVIIPHYRDLDRLKRCLTALEPQLAAHADCQAVVVDNNSKLDFSGLSARFPHVRFLCEPEKGAAAARNKGVRETRSMYLFFLDADCVPGEDWLAAARSLAGSHDIIGGRIDTFDETPRPRSGAEAFEAVFAFNQRSYIEDQGFAVTANLLTSRAVFEDVGGFLAHVSEDKDWCQRAGEKGYRLTYCAELRALHPTRADWPALWKKWQRLLQESFQLHGTGPAQRLTWGLRSLAVLASAPVHMVKVLASRKLDSWQDRLRGLAVLYRLRFARAMWMLGQAFGLRE